MATRSRTLLFLQYRNSFARPSYHPTSSVAADTERAGLIDSSYHIIELSVLPPKWVDITEEVDSDIQKIREKIQELDAMHRKHLLPGFDDRTSDEAAIERLTAEITNHFQASQHKIQRINTESLPNSVNTPSELQLARNIQTSLATKLQEVSSSFRRNQNAYMSRLKGQEIRKSDILGIESGSEALAAELDIDFTTSQLAHIESSSAAISQREREINEIAKSIYQLAEIFKELQTMVIDQGTMLDRIDYNIEQVTVNVQEGAADLVEGAKYQRNAGRRQCIFLLILIIIGLIIVLIFKPRRH